MYVEVIMTRKEDFKTMQEQTDTNFLREYKDGIDWFTLCCWRKFTEDELRQFKDYVKWNLVLYTHKLSESFMREFLDYLDVNDMARNKELSMDFIRELYMQHDLDLKNLVTYGNLEQGPKRREIIGQYTYYIRGRKV